VRRERARERERGERERERERARASAYMCVCVCLFLVSACRTSQTFLRFPMKVKGEFGREFNRKDLVVEENGLVHFATSFK
jgi:hypothetical protein